MFIEEGVMNFWAMWGALGAFTCSGLLLAHKIYELVKRRRAGTEPSLTKQLDYAVAMLEDIEKRIKK